MIMKNIVTISLLFISFYSCVKTQQPYALCSQVYQMYHYCTNASPVTANVVETKIGKKGPKGDRGSPSYVNYTSINSRIDEKMKDIEMQVDEFGSDLIKKHEVFVNETKNDEEIQKAAINEINEKIASLSSSLEEMTNRIQHTCPILYDNKCFLPVMNKEATLDEARDICAEMSGKLADIYNTKHLDFLMKQIRANHMNGKSYVDLRLGMTIEPSTGQVSLTDGTKVTYLNKWYPGDPSKHSTFTSVILHVDQSPTTVMQYPHNDTPTYKYNFLCEI